MEASQHRLLPEQLVVKLLDLGVEAQAAIGSPSESARISEHVFAQLADAARTGTPGVGLVGFRSVGESEASERGAAQFGRLQNRIQTEQPVPIAVLEVRVGRKG